MHRKNVAVIGIITSIVYFFITLSLIITRSEIWVNMLEIITMFSGFVMVTIIVSLPFSKNEKLKKNKIMSIILVAACMILTNIVHIVSISVVDPLIKSGVNIPEFMQIGKYPSVIMAIDYLGWGLFMGLSFIFSSIAVEQELKAKKIKYVLLISGILCIVGFLGSMIINENLWYIAPIGYGIGTFILCIQLIYFDK